MKSIEKSYKKMDDLVVALFLETNKNSQSLVIPIVHNCHLMLVLALVPFIATKT